MNQGTVNEAERHVGAIMALARSGQISWSPLPVPKPDAARSFQGVAKGYVINVIQANTVEYGIVHEGMVIASEAFMLVRLRTVEAGELFHLAQANQN